MNTTEIVVLVASLVLVGIGIASQIALLTSADTRKLQDSLQLWFGNLGLVFYWLLIVFVAAMVRYVPELLRLVLKETRLLTADVRTTLFKINDLTAHIKSLSADVQKSAKVAELLKSGVNLANQAARALGATPVPV